VDLRRIAVGRPEQHAIACRDDLADLQAGRRHEFARHRQDVGVGLGIGDDVDHPAVGEADRRVVDERDPSGIRLLRQDRGLPARRVGFQETHGFAGPASAPAA
jgi:hypothetical protein